jgi:hypothetical protein
MAEEIRRRIRWENRERLRKKREEKDRSRDSQQKRESVCDADVSEPRIVTTISSTNKLGCLKSTPADFPVAKNAPVAFTVIGPSPDISVASPRTSSHPLTPTTCRNEKAYAESKFHPTVLEQTGSKCLRPTVNFMDDSDDDVDLLRDAMLLARSRRDSDRKPSPKSVRCKAGVTMPPVVAAVTMVKPIDDSDSDDDLLRDVKLLHEKRKAGLRAKERGATRSEPGRGERLSSNSRECGVSSILRARYKKKKATNTNWALSR